MRKSQHSHMELSTCGIVDITVEEVLSENALKEIDKSSGGAWEGTKVDAEFEKLMETLAGTGTQFLYLMTIYTPLITGATSFCDALINEPCYFRDVA
ncbi:hypothetical protein DPMN_120276 [Dreissena polymorpha]|uniref:Uncharacterized protein n=1 Tax=Dreissena polymorpha TaxID=45954 RepID=A0A9D4JNE3_DREPO|nr:hypothetical protein DPMN_120276 [Dreissena polymorpha]